MESKTIRKTIRVCGNVQKRRRPHIRLFGVVYRSRPLSDSYEMVGTSITVEIDPEDLRTVVAFFPSGAEMGKLQAAGSWASFKHSIALRRELLRKQMQNRHLAFDPLREYIKSLEDKPETLRQGQPDREPPTPDTYRFSGMNNRETNAPNAVAEVSAQRGPKMLKRTLLI